MARRILAAMLAATVTIGSGCTKDDDKGPTAPEAPSYRAPTSPENVLHNLTVAYETRDIEGYTDALDPEFTFVPSAGDQDQGLVPFDYDADLQSTENMFENVERIDIQLTHDEAVDSDRMEYPADAGYKMILVSRVNLAIVTRMNIGGEPLILQTGGDPATFIFRPDATVSPTEYHIVYQKDDS